jgi:transposase-like protein
MAKDKKAPHTKEFNEEAVGLTVTSGKPITQVAKDLGITPCSTARSSAGR